MTNTHIRNRLLAGTIIAGSMLAATSAFAQAKPADQPVDIIVTGSRIAQPNLTSAAPVTVVSAQDIKLTGTTRVEDLINQLPQVFAGQNSTISNGSDGTATVDLRGLGPRRTLVLIDGRRLLPGDPGSSAADLNAVPGALVKRVEVLTGGASATYGADAVAGVVNFIMDKNFTGIRLDGQYSMYQHNNNNAQIPPLDNLRTAAGACCYSYPTGSSVDGGTTDATLSIGTGFDDNRGHVVAYVGYRNVNAVLQSQRDYSSCTLQNVPGSRTNMRCGGSGTSAEGNFLDGTSNSYHIAANANGFAPGLTRYNFAPLNYYQRPDERYTAGFFAHYDVSDAIKPYMDFMFMDDRTVAQIAPSGDFGNTLTINCDNPLLSAGQKGLLCTPLNLVNAFFGNAPRTGYNTTGPSTNPLNGQVYTGAPLNFFDPVTGAAYNIGKFQLLRRNVEGGPRVDDREHTEYRAVMGSKGDLGKVWSYDAYYQYGRTLLSETYSNELSASRLRNALDVVTGPNGQPECRVTETGQDPSCVPYNVFTPNGVTQAAIKYLAAQGFQRGVNTEQVASASFTGRLGKYGVKTPWASEGLTVNLGAEYRNETLDLKTDQEFQTGDLTGQGSPTLPINGSYSVKEGFIEGHFPIVHDTIFYNLSLDAAYRYSSYKYSNNNKFNTDTYKLGAEFAPVKDITFRASYNRAVRAPNLQELLATGHVGLDGTTDPCSGTTPTASLAACLKTGITAAQYGKITANPAAQYNGFLGGNGNLTPERAITKTFGVVLQPRFIPRLALTVDYFDIKITNAVQTFGADTIINACLSATGTAATCSLIHRSPGSGSLWLTPDGFITDTQQNIGGYSTKGIDVNLGYNTRLGKIGALNFSLVGTALNSLVTDNGFGAPYDCAGYYGANCGNPNPKWRHKARVTLNTPSGVGLSLQWRYAGPVNVDYTSTNTSLNNPLYSQQSAHINAQSYFDLSATFKFANHFNWRMGVNNIMDRTPPLVTSGASNGSIPSACAGVSCNGNTYPGTYDALGRYFYMGATLDF